MGTIGTIWGLRPDGSFWQFDEDFGIELAPLPEELEVQALVFGSDRHLWLKALLPVRPESAAPCTLCGGRARLGEVSLCAACHGLGWIP